MFFKLLLVTRKAYGITYALTYSQQPAFTASKKV